MRRNKDCHKMGGDNLSSTHSRTTFYSSTIASEAHKRRGDLLLVQGASLLQKRLPFCRFSTARAESLDAQRLAGLLESRSPLCDFFEALAIGRAGACLAADHLPCFVFF